MPRTSPSSGMRFRPPARAKGAPASCRRSSPGCREKPRAAPRGSGRPGRSRRSEHRRNPLPSPHPRARRHPELLSSPRSNGTAFDLPAVGRPAMPITRTPCGCRKDHRMLHARHSCRLGPRRAFGVGAGPCPRGPANPVPNRDTPSRPRCSKGSRPAIGHRRHPARHPGRSTGP